MIALISFSAAVSFLTLAILLFRPGNPANRVIPAAFLGGTEKNAPLHLRMSPPPFLPWLLILLATLGVALAYFPPDNSHRSQSGRKAVVWVDRTLSAVVGRAENKINASEIADRIIEDGFDPLGISEVFGGEKSTLQYTFQPLSSKAELERHVVSEWNKPPLAFVHPVETAAFSEAVKNDPLLSSGQATLILVTDGQQETMQNFSALRSSFANVKVILTPRAASMIGKRTEIVPTQIFELWNEKIPDGVSGSAAFAAFNPEGSQIPEQARPHFFKETFHDLKIATGSPQSRALRLPMLTGCGLEASGPAELDTFSDLHALARFFSTPFRLQDCHSIEEKREAAENDPWKYRNGSIWVIPADEQVLNTLQANTWIPGGFSEKTDAVVYVADPRLAKTESRALSRMPVQLDEGGLQAPLYLIPPPPAGEINHTTEKGVSISSKFESVYNAADKTPLGYKLRKLPIFWLRTTAAMPNGELGRSSSWTNFWLYIAKEATADVPQMNRREFTDASDFYSTTAGPFSPKEFLNPENLQFVPQNLATLGLVPGVYRMQGGDVVLVQVPAAKYTKNYILPEDFESAWSSGRSANTVEKNHASRAPLSVSGGALALLALSLFWFFKRRSPAASAFLILFCFLQTAHAQPEIPPAFRNPGSAPLRKQMPVPYRVSWCDAEIPAAVQERYMSLRNLLASRGTVVMPEKMVAGLCRPGAAEVWWTADATALTQPLLSQHVSLGGIFVLEGFAGELPQNLLSLSDSSIGLDWEIPPKRGILFRSFYLLQNFDGCIEDKTRMLTLRKKSNAHSPIAIATGARFLTTGNAPDCFATDDDYRSRSFINMMYSFMATDYKEDQLQLPEILNRVRNLGLEP